MLLQPHLQHNQSGIQFLGWGAYLPAEVVSNQALIEAGGLPVTDAWIQQRVGVQQRHRVAPDESTSDMALAAARQALAQARTHPEELDLIVVSTISPDHPSPSTACLLQAGLGVKGCPAFDLKAACSGFIYALDTAARHLLTGARKVLVVSAEVRSRFVNPQDPATAPIFGDAAAAVVLGQGPVGEGLLGVQILADGQGYHSVMIPAGGARLPASAETVAAGQHFLQMPRGEQVFFEVVEGMTQQTPVFLEQLGLSLAEVDFVIPHQANLNILKEVARRLELPWQKMLVNIEQVANTSSASIPLAYCHFQPQIPPGSKVLMLAVGAGHTMGLALLQTPWHQAPGAD